MRLRQTPDRDETSTSAASTDVFSRPDSARILNGLAVLFCIGLYLYHFFVVWTYAVDIPFWDEWAVLQKGALSPQLDASWIFAQHNEHRIATDKLLIWSLYHINGWDIAAQQLFNFLLYGVLLLVVIQMARKIAPQMPLWAILAFVVFLLSPLNHENHLMGFQSSFHFVVLFFLSAILFLFDTKGDAGEKTTQSWTSLLAGSLFAILSIYSLASGLVSCAILLLVFGLWKLNRARNAEGALRKREWQQLVFAGASIFGAMLLWLNGWSSAAGDIARGTPFSSTFWAWFLNALSAGFGFEWRTPVLLGLWTFCFLSFFNTWSYFRFYPDQYAEREAGAACVAKYYESGNPSGKDWRCRSIYPAALNAQLERARELNVSFSRKRTR